jgi:hypothetical protein
MLYGLDLVSDVRRCRLLKSEVENMLLILFRKPVNFNFKLHKHLYCP